MLLGNETVIKQKHIEGTTHAYDIFSPKQFKFGSGGLTGRKSGGATVNSGLVSRRPCLVSEASGTPRKSEALGPLLTSGRLLISDFI